MVVCVTVFNYCVSVPFPAFTPHTVRIVFISIFNVAVTVTRQSSLSSVAYAVHAVAVVADRDGWDRLEESSTIQSRLRRRRCIVPRCLR